jgi:hypothetical protein
MELQKAKRARTSMGADGGHVGGDVVVGIYIECFQGDEAAAKAALLEHRPRVLDGDDAAAAAAAPPAKKVKKEKNPAAAAAAAAAPAPAPAKKAKKEKKASPGGGGGGKGSRVGSGPNAALADLFYEMAVLEGGGFKANAYNKVGDALCTMAAVTEATGKKGGQVNGAKIDGIGKASAEKMAEFLETGKISKLETMRAGGS